MAKTSANIAKVNKHSFKHNDRTEENPAKTIFKQFTKNNICNVSSLVASKNFDNLYLEATSKVKGRIRKAHKDNTLVEALIVIDENTTMQDLDNLAKYIEKTFNFTSLQISIHRDEGHYKDDEFKINQHAHLSFFTLNLTTGAQMFRKYHLKHKLSDLQTKTAEILKMERGVKKSISGAHRFSHKDYKVYIQEKEKLEEQIKKYRKMLQDLEISKNKVIDNLQEEKEILEKIANLRNIEISDLKSQNEMKAKEIIKTIEVEKTVEVEVPVTKYIENPINTQLQKENEKLENKNKTLNSKIVKKINLISEAFNIPKDLNFTFFDSVVDVFRSLQEQNKTLEAKVGDLQEQNEALQEQNKVLESKDTTSQEKSNPEANMSDYDDLFKERKQQDYDDYFKEQKQQKQQDYSL